MFKVIEIGLVTSILLLVLLNVAWKQSYICINRNMLNQTGKRPAQNVFRAQTPNAKMLVNNII